MLHPDSDSEGARWVGAEKGTLLYLRFECWALRAPLLVGTFPAHSLGETKANGKDPHQQAPFE